MLQASKFSNPKNRENGPAWQGLELNYKVHNLLNSVDTSPDNTESKQENSYRKTILVIMSPKTSLFILQVEAKAYFCLAKNMYKTPQTGINNNHKTVISKERVFLIM